MLSTMDHITCTVEVTLKLPKKVSPNKASGPDSTPARILKKLADETDPLLTAVVNKSLEEGEVTKDWRRASDTAIFEQGVKYKPSNCWPVSLTFFCCKLQTHILVSNISNHLDKHAILIDFQNGFQSEKLWDAATWTCTRPRTFLRQEKVDRPSDSRLLESLWSCLRPETNYWGS